MQEVARDMLQDQDNPAALFQETVVSDHRRNGDADPDRRRDQRFSDRPRDYIEVGRTLGADILERMHDAPDRSEQPDEGRRAADAGEPAETRIQKGFFLLDLLAHRAFDQIVPGFVRAGIRIGRIPDFHYLGIASLPHAPGFARVFTVPFNVESFALFKRLMKKWLRISLSMTSPIFSRITLQVTENPPNT